MSAPEKGREGPIMIQWPEGKDEVAQAVLELIRASGLAALPVAFPANGGIQGDGSLRFRDVSGRSVTAKPGDWIMVTDMGWQLSGTPDE